MCKLWQTIGRSKEGELAFIGEAGWKFGSCCCDNQRVHWRKPGVLSIVAFHWFYCYSLLAGLSWGGEFSSSFWVGNLFSFFYLIITPCLTCFGVILLIFIYVCVCMFMCVCMCVFVCVCSVAQSCPTL